MKEKIKKEELWEFIQATFWIFLVVGAPILFIGNIIGENIFLWIFGIVWFFCGMAILKNNVKIFNNPRKKKLR